MNHLSCMTARLHVFQWALASILSISAISAAYAQSTGTDPAGAQGNWHSNVNGVSQTARVGASSNGVEIGININGEDRVPKPWVGQPGAVIREQPRGPQRLSAPGISVPGWSNPGTLPDPVLPRDGSNIIVAGGPTSVETSPGRPPTTFGGFSIGGW